MGFNGVDCLDGLGRVDLSDQVKGLGRQADFPGARLLTDRPFQPSLHHIFLPDKH